MVSNTERFGDEAFPKRVAPRALGSKVTMSTLPNSVGSTAVGLDTQRDLDGEEKKAQIVLTRRHCAHTKKYVHCIYHQSYITQAANQSYNTVQKSICAYLIGRNESKAMKGEKARI